MVVVFPWIKDHTCVFWKSKRPRAFGSSVGAPNSLSAPLSPLSTRWPQCFCVSQTPIVHDPPPKATGPFLFQGFLHQTDTTVSWRLTDSCPVGSNSVSLMICDSIDVVQVQVAFIWGRDYTTWFGFNLLPRALMQPLCLVNICCPVYWVWLAACFIRAFKHRLFSWRINTICHLNFGLWQGRGDALE